MDKHQTKYTLFEAVAKRPFGYEYEYSSIWKLQRNFGIDTYDKLNAYCKRVGLKYHENHDEFRIEFTIDRDFQFKKLSKKKFKDTAVLSKCRNPDSEHYYNHFGIHPVSCCVYGDKPEDIENVQLSFHPYQNLDQDASEYWGFYLYSDDKISYIHNNYSMMSICFSEGAINAEKNGKGFAVKLNVKSLGKIDMSKYDPKTMQLLK